MRPEDAALPFEPPYALRFAKVGLDVPPSEDLAYTFDYATLKLAGWLLKDGEREPVITFLERFAAMPVSHKAC